MDFRAAPNDNRAAPINVTANTPAASGTATAAASVPIPTIAAKKPARPSASMPSCFQSTPTISFRA